MFSALLNRSALVSALVCAVLGGALVHAHATPASAGTTGTVTTNSTVPPLFAVPPTPTATPGRTERTAFVGDVVILSAPVTEPISAFGWEQAVDPAAPIPSWRSIDPVRDLSFAVATVALGSKLAFRASSARRWLFRGTASNAAGRSTIEFSVIATTKITAVAPTLSSQPSPLLTFNAGTTQELTVVAAGSPLPTVLWEQRLIGSSTWTAVALGANRAEVRTTNAAATTTSTLTLVTAASDSGTQLRASISNAAGSIQSTPTDLQVSVAPTFDPFRTGYAVKAGDSLTLTVSGRGTPAPAVTWEYDVNGVWVAVPSQRGPSLTVQPRTVGATNYYRAVASNLAGTVRSATISVQAVAGNPVAPRLSGLPPTLWYFDAKSPSQSVALAASGNPKPTLSALIQFADGTSAPVVVKAADSASPGATNVVVVAFGKTPKSLAVTAVSNAGSATTTIDFKRGVAARWSVDPQALVTTNSSEVSLLAQVTGSPAPVVIWRESIDNLVYDEDDPTTPGPNGATSYSVTLGEVGSLRYVQACFRQFTGAALTCTPPVTATRVALPKVVSPVLASGTAADTSSETILSDRFGAITFTSRATGVVRGLYDLYPVVEYQNPAAGPKSWTPLSWPNPDLSTLDADGKTRTASFTVTGAEPSFKKTISTGASRVAYRITWYGCSARSDYDPSPGQRPTYRFVAGRSALTPCDAAPTHASAIDPAHHTTRPPGPLRFVKDLPSNLNGMLDEHSAHLNPIQLSGRVDESDGFVSYQWFKQDAWGVTSRSAVTSGGGAGAHITPSLADDRATFWLVATDAWGRTVTSTKSTFRVVRWNFYDGKPGFARVRVFNDLPVTSVQPTVLTGGWTQIGPATDGASLETPPEGALGLPAGSYFAFGWNWAWAGTDVGQWFVPQPGPPGYQIFIHQTGAGVSCAITRGRTFVVATDAPIACAGRDGKSFLPRGTSDDALWFSVSAAKSAASEPITVTDPDVQSRIAVAFCDDAAAIGRSNDHPNAVCTLDKDVEQHTIEVPSNYQLVGQWCPGSNDPTAKTNTILASRSVSYSFNSAVNWNTEVGLIVGVEGSVGPASVNAASRIETGAGGEVSNTVAVTQTAGAYLMPNQVAYVSISAEATVYTGTVTVHVGNLEYLLPRTSFTIVKNPVKDGSVRNGPHDDGIFTSQLDVPSTVMTRDMSGAEISACRNGIDRVNQ